MMQHDQHNATESCTVHQVYLQSEKTLCQVLLEVGVTGWNKLEREVVEMTERVGLDNVQDGRGFVGGELEEKPVCVCMCVCLSY